MRFEDTGTRRNQSGFTIVELLIATAVLSIVLLIATLTITGISDLFFKGFNQSRIQNDARNITNEVAQHLQLSDGYLTATNTSDPTRPVVSYCIDTTRYSALVNYQIGSNSNQSLHVLWRDTVASGSCSALSAATMNTATPTAGGVELIAPSSRLTAFSIAGTSPFTISVGVAYGDDDLLHLAGLNTTCNSGTGSQFCATASLTTAVSPRVSTGS